MNSNRIEDNSQFIPYKNDYLYKTISFLGKQNPFLTGSWYFIISYIVLYIVGYFTGQIYGNEKVPAMYLHLIDNVNLGVLAPIGAALLCNLYNKITYAFEYIENENIITDNEIINQETDKKNILTNVIDFIKLRIFRIKNKQITYLKLKHKIFNLYNSKIILIFSIITSLAINSNNYFYKTESFLSISGGLTGLYGRIFIIFNFFMITFILLKTIITVWALQKILSCNFKIEPMHPDRSGGLKPIGDMALSVNYFLGLVIVFFSLLVFFDSFSKSNIIYMIIIVSVYIMSPILLFKSLSKAYKRMSDTKQEALNRLRNTFQHYYNLLNINAKEKGIYDIKNADEIGSIHSLYEIVEKMPVWPFDIKTTLRFYSMITVPIFLFLIEILTNSDSIIYNFDKFQQLFTK